VNFCGIEKLAMTLAVRARELEIKETGVQATVGDGCVPRIMYYLNCVEYVTKIGIPTRFTRYARPDLLSHNDKNDLFELAKRFSPEIMVRVGLFVLDADSSLCHPLWNRFFSVTDTQFAALANSEIVIAGMRVRMARIMFFCPAWLERNYTSPLAELGRSLSIREIEMSRPPPTSFDVHMERRKATCWDKSACCVISVPLLIVLGLTLASSIRFLQNPSILFGVSVIKPVYYVWMVHSICLALISLTGLFTVCRCCRQVARVLFGLMVSVTLIITIVALIFAFAYDYKLEGDMKDVWNEDDERSEIESAFECCGWKTACDRVNISNINVSNGTGEEPIPTCQGKVVPEYEILKNSIFLGAILMAVVIVPAVGVICVLLNENDQEDSSSGGLL
jgi:hypothetical protein